MDGDVDGDVFGPPVTKSGALVGVGSLCGLGAGLLGAGAGLDDGGGSLSLPPPR